MTRPRNPYRNASSDDIVQTIWLCIVALALFGIACLTVLN